MRIKVCPAKRKHLTAMLDLALEMIEHEHDVLGEKWIDPGYPLTPAAAKFFVSFIKRHFAYVAIAEGKVVGFLIGNIKTNHTVKKMAKLESVYVKEQYRQMGVASRLAAHFKEYCLKKGVTYIEVTVYRSNANARAFYDKLGFTPSREVLVCDITQK